MSKAHRGKNIKLEMLRAGRGTCPICRRSGIKLHFEQEIADKKISTCKSCKAALAHGKYKDRVAAL